MYKISVNANGKFCSFHVEIGIYKLFAYNKLYKQYLMIISNLKICVVNILGKWYIILYVCNIYNKEWVAFSSAVLIDRSLYINQADLCATWLELWIDLRNFIFTLPKIVFRKLESWKIYEKLYRYSHQSWHTDKCSYFFTQNQTILLQYTKSQICM